MCWKGVVHHYRMVKISCGLVKYWSQEDQNMPVSPSIHYVYYYAIQNKRSGVANSALDSVRYMPQLNEEIAQKRWEISKIQMSGTFCEI